MADENRNLQFDIPMDSPHVKSGNVYRLPSPEFANDWIFDGVVSEDEGAEAPPGRITRAFAAEKKNQIAAGASSSAAHQDPPSPRRVTRAAAASKKKLPPSPVAHQVPRSPRRVTRAAAAAKKMFASSPAAHQEPPGTVPLGESSSRRLTGAEKKKKSIVAAGAISPAGVVGENVVRPDKLTHFTYMKARTPLKAPSVCPPTVMDSNRLDGLLSSFGRRQLITMLTSAYHTHLDVRALADFQASELERKIYFHNVPLDFTPSTIENMLAVFGSIDDVVILHTKHDKETRKGYILFSNVEGATKVVAASKDEMIFLVCHTAKEGCRDQSEDRREECVF